MKKRKLSIPRPPENFNCLRRDPKSLRKSNGETAIQSVGFAADGSVVCCGVYYDSAMSIRALWKHASSWKRWRRWYDGLPWNVREDYPAKHDPKVTHWYAHPVANPHVSIGLTVGF